MKNIMFKISGVLTIVLLSLLLGSCESIKYVPVETVRTEYINRVDTVEKTDTLVREKEIIIREADSASLVKLGLQLKDNESAILILQKELEKQISKHLEHKIDTIEKNDTIQVPYQVERNITFWEKTKIRMGGFALAGCLILIIIIISHLVRFYRKT